MIQGRSLPGQRVKQAFSRIVHPHAGSQALDQSENHPEARDRDEADQRDEQERRRRFDRERLRFACQHVATVRQSGKWAV